MRMFATAIAIATALAPASAQEPGSRQTREFVQAAGQSDQFELLEARTVLTQSADPHVRAFAQQMITDHGGTRRALEQAAAKSGLPPPAIGLSDDQARLLSELQSLRGPGFDQAYLRHQVLAHRSALVVEQAYAAHGDDVIVRQAAASAAPVIASHLAMAQQMREEHGGS
jgi:putative membrane protein